MDVPLTPLALVERGFATYPDRPAVVEAGRVLTYRAFGARVRRAAGAVRALGVEAGERVALLAPNTAAALECYTAVPLARAVLVPLNTRLSADEYRYILGHSGARVLVVDASLLEAVRPALDGLGPVTLVVQGAAARDADLPPGAYDYETLVASAEPVAFAYDDIDERGLCTLNYTSGTTARPKGVGITHRGAYLNAVNMVFALRLRPEDVHLHVAPMFHANGWGFVRMGHSGEIAMQSHAARYLEPWRVRALGSCGLFRLAEKAVAV